MIYILLAIGILIFIFILFGQSTKRKSPAHRNPPAPPEHKEFYENIEEIVNNYWHTNIDPK